MVGNEDMGKEGGVGEFMGKEANVSLMKGLLLGNIVVDFVVVHSPVPGLSVVGLLVGSGVIITSTTICLFIGLGISSCVVDSFVCDTI